MFSIINEKQTTGINSQNGSIPTASSNNQRYLNNVVFDALGVTVNPDNSFTIPAGVFELHVKASSNNTGPQRVILWDSINNVSLWAGDSVSGSPTLDAVLTFTTSATLSIQHYFGPNVNANDFGLAVGDGNPETYTTVKISTLPSN